MKYVELSQFLWTWAVSGDGVLDAEVLEKASHVSDQPFNAGWGHVVLKADGLGSKLSAHSLNVDSSG